MVKYRLKEAYLSVEGLREEISINPNIDDYIMGAMKHEGTVARIYPILPSVKRGSFEVLPPVDINYSHLEEKANYNALKIREEETIQYIFSESVSNFNDKVFGDGIYATTSLSEISSFNISTFIDYWRHYISNTRNRLMAPCVQHILSNINIMHLNDCIENGINNMVFTREIEYNNELTFNDISESLRHTVLLNTKVFGSSIQYYHLKFNREIWDSLYDQFDINIRYDPKHMHLFVGDLNNITHGLAFILVMSLDNLDSLYPYIDSDLLTADIKDAAMQKLKYTPYKLIENSWAPEEISEEEPEQPNNQSEILFNKSFKERSLIHKLFN